MARAIATCKCASCGKEFKKIAYKNNSAQAYEWKKWAEENIIECPQCYSKRMRAEDAQKPFTIEFRVDTYAPAVVLVATGNTYPHKDALKEAGYSWSEPPCQSVLAEPTEYIPKAWHKIITITPDNVDSFQDRLQCAVDEAKRLDAKNKNAASKSALAIVMKHIEKLKNEKEQK